MGLRRLLVLAAGLALLAAAARAEGLRLALSCGAVGTELEQCRRSVADWERATGNRVDIVSTPNSSTDRLALYLQILAARAPDLDVLQIDVVWPGVLAPHLLDLGPHMGDAPSRHFASLIENDTIDGRLVAMPWWIDAGILYFRRDLLAAHGFDVPATWAELGATAASIQAAERAAGRETWGYVFQGKAYEGLTCNALEWIAGFGGGTILAADGAVTVANPAAAEALDLIAGWIGRIAPPGVLNYDEEAARGVFQSGRAVFMRNWPYAWALAQGPGSAVRGRVGVAVLPRGGGAGGQATGTLGGWHLAVSRYSRHPAAAADLVRHMTQAAVQKRRALEASYNPTIEALYRDPDLLAANPILARLYDSFANAVPRPSAIARDHYARVSFTFWRAVHDILAGHAPAGPRLAALARALERIARRAGW